MRKMLKSVILAMTIISSSALAQVDSVEQIPGTDENVAPICRFYPQLCLVGFGDLSAVQSTGDDDAIIVPICRLFPQLCIPGPAEGNGFRMGVVTQDTDSLRSGMIVINPRQMYVREGLIVIPQDFEAFYGLE